jgi:hypothetical protein
MKLMNNLIVLPMIICLLGCPMACSPAPADDDDSSGDDDDATGDDDDDSAEGIIFMDEVRIFIENVCDNDLDDDHDGITDCDDADCEFAPDCVGF